MYWKPRTLLFSECSKSRGDCKQYPLHKPVARRAVCTAAVLVTERGMTELTASALLSANEPKIAFRGSTCPQTPSDAQTAILPPRERLSTAAKIARRSSPAACGRVARRRPSPCRPGRESRRNAEAGRRVHRLRWRAADALGAALLSRAGPQTVSGVSSSMTLLVRAPNRLLHALLNHRRDRRPGSLGERRQASTSDTRVSLLEAAQPPVACSASPRRPPGQWDAQSVAGSLQAGCQAIAVPPLPSIQPGSYSHEERGTEGEPKG